MKVSAAEIAENFKRDADQAMAEPVSITRNGNEELVLLSASEYARLSRRDRQVFRAHEVPDDLLAAIASSEPPDEAGRVEAMLAAEAR
jgi:prevent-host-death family protein